MTKGAVFNPNYFFQYLTFLKPFKKKAHLEGVLFIQIKLTCVIEQHTTDVANRFGWI